MAEPGRMVAASLDGFLEQCVARDTDLSLFRDLTAYTVAIWRDGEWLLHMAMGAPYVEVIESFPWFDSPAMLIFLPATARDADRQPQDALSALALHRELRTWEVRTWIWATPDAAPHVSTDAEIANPAVAAAVRARLGLDATS